MSLLLLAVGGALLCGCPSGDTAEYLPYADSPYGSVLFGSRAYSPDGQYYAREIAPQGAGQIGVFNRATDEQVWSWDCAADMGGGNVLKGLAWSSDSTRVAVVYHGGAVNGSGVYAYDLFEEGLAAKGSVGAYCHYIRYADGDNNTVYLLDHYSGYYLRYTVALTEVTEDAGDDDPDEVVGFQKYSGCNYPWINYGWDLGHNPWGGSRGGFAVNAAKLKTDFAAMQAAGVKLVRVFLFCDFRGAVNSGDALSFDGYVTEDMDALIAAAKECDLKLLPVLLDYTIADGVSSESGTRVGEHPDWLIGSDLVALLTTFVSRYGQDDAIYAWDVINEPEYCTAVDLSTLKAFVSKMSDAIHKNAKQSVTVGCGSLTTMLAWQDAGLDLYQFHRYDNMGTDWAAAFPSVSSLGLALDHPVIVGEIQPTDIASKLAVIEAAGYTGALFWSWRADYDFPAVADDFKNYFAGSANQ